MCAYRGSANCLSLAGISMPTGCTHVCSFPWLDLYFFASLLWCLQHSVWNSLKCQIIRFPTWVSLSLLFCCGRQRGTTLCVRANTFWHFAAVPVRIHSQLFALCTLHCWFVKHVQCLLYVNEMSRYRLRFCSTVSFISMSILFSHITCYLIVV